MADYTVNFEMEFDVNNVDSEEEALHNALECLLDNLMMGYTPVHTIEKRNT